MISVGCLAISVMARFEGLSEDTLTKTKEMLDDMHKRKIDRADEIFVINVDGNIGSSTRAKQNTQKPPKKEFCILNQ